MKKNTKGKIREFTILGIAFLLLAVTITSFVSADTGQVDSVSGIRTLYLPWKAYHYEGTYNRTYFTFLNGSTGNPEVIYYDHSTHSWSNIYQITSPATVTNAHGSPSIIADSNGYIYVSWGDGFYDGSNLYLVKSTNPEDISSWGSVQTIATGSYTAYPQILPLQNLTFTYRDGSAGQYWKLTKYITSNTSTTTKNIENFDNDTAGAASASNPSESWYSLVSNNFSVWDVSTAQAHSGTQSLHGSHDGTNSDEIDISLNQSYEIKYFQFYTYMVQQKLYFIFANASYNAGNADSTSLSGNAGPWIIVDSSNINYKDSTGTNQVITSSTNLWNTWVLWNFSFDWANHQFTVIINGTSYGPYSFEAPINDMKYAIFWLGGGYTADMYIDDIEVGISSSGTTQGWTSASTILDFGSYRPYVYPFLDNGRMYWGISYHDDTSDHQRNLYLIYSDDGGSTWYEMGSTTALTLPISYSDLTPIITSDATEIYGGWVYNGNPYMICESGGYYKLAYWDGSAWQVKTIVADGSGTTSFKGQGASVYVDSTGIYAYVPIYENSHYNIKEYKSTDGGATWSKTADITSSSTEDYGYPFVPINQRDEMRLLYIREDGANASTPTFWRDSNTPFYYGISGNSPPTCSITSPSNGATVSGTITIQGTASDSDGTVQSVEVKIDSGTWQTATGTTSWNYSWDTTTVSDGSHTIYARSYDGTDYSTEASVTVTVSNGGSTNNPPNAPSNPTPADGATNVAIDTHLSWSCSDPDGDSLTYDVYLGEGTTPHIIAHNITTTSYFPGNYNYNIVYYWKIVAWDSHGASTSSPTWSFTTVSSGGNAEPTCSLSASPSSGTAPLTVTFSMSASDSDGSIASWSLDVDNDGSPEYSGSGNPPATQSHTYSNAGTYTAKLTVTDDDGASSYNTVTITVSSSGGSTGGLTADFDYSVSNLNVTFTDTSTDSNGNIVSWHWDFGDGNTSTEQNPTHTYSSYGTYTVTLTVTDDDGSSDNVTKTVVVSNLVQNIHEVNSLLISVAPAFVMMAALASIVFMLKRRR